VDKQVIKKGGLTLGAEQGLDQGRIIQRARKEVQLVTFVALPEDMGAAFGTEVPRAVCVTPFARFGTEFRRLALLEPEILSEYGDEGCPEGASRPATSRAIARAGFDDSALGFILNVATMTLSGYPLDR
jgi:hypothetical protein